MERTKLGTMALAGSYGGAVLGMPVSGGVPFLAFTIFKICSRLLR